MLLKRCRTPLLSHLSRSPLHDAAQAGQADLLRELLTPPPELAAPPTDELAGVVSGRTPLPLLPASAAAVALVLASIEQASNQSRWLHPNSKMTSWCCDAFTDFKALAASPSNKQAGRCACTVCG